MTVIDTLKRVAAAPEAYARAWKAETGKPVVATFCSYTPEEVLHAAGVLGVRMLGSGAPIERAGAHLQTYSCHLVRGALDDVLSGRLEFLDGAVFPHTCDSIQRLSDIWRMNAGLAFHADILLPVKFTTESAKDYAVDVFRAFCRELSGGLGVSVSDAGLREAARLFNDIRASVEVLYRIRRDRPGVMTGSDLAAVLRAGMVMARNDFRDALDALIADCNAVPAGGPAAAAIPLVLSGGVCTMPDLYGAIEAAGGRVVYDDLCTGARGYEGRIAIDGDILANIAERYLARPICPAKHRGNRSRAEALLETVRATDARGVIYVVLKFCDPHGFDYPYIKQMLDASGVPSLLLELEDRGTADGRLRTRIEAFIERL